MAEETKFAPTTPKVSALSTTDLSFNLPADKFDEIVDVWCAKEGYRDEINGEPNPESKLNFTKRTLRTLVINAWVAAQANQAADAARATLEGV